MTPLFYIAHATPGRTRIRWAGDSDHKHIVNEFATDIANIAGVVKAEPRTVTGSIVIQHDGLKWPALQSALSDQRPIRFTAGPSAIKRNGVDAVNDSIDAVNIVLKRVNMDFDSLLIFTLLTLSIVQALRGQVLSSSVSFLWYAFTLAAIARDKETKHRDNKNNNSI